MKLKFKYRTNLDSARVFVLTPDVTDEEDDDHELEMEVNYTFQRGQVVEVDHLEQIDETTVHIHMQQHSKAKVVAYDCDVGWFEIVEEQDMNSIMVIAPYKFQGIWVFDDKEAGLEKEALVAGVPEIIERVCTEQKVHDPENGFSITFSADPFPGHHLKTTWLREGDDGFGNWYSAYDGTMEGWLCPALFKYFDKAPEHLYLQVASRPL